MSVLATEQMVQSDDLRLMIFPAALLLYYFICWLLVGRDPKIETVATQYQAPPGISPGIARYVLTGGSDGTTLAAILADLAAKQVISLQPEGKSYRIKLLNAKAAVMPEEAAALKSLLGAELPAQAYAATHTAKISAAPAQQHKPDAPIFGDDVLESTMGTAAPHIRSETLLDPRAGPEIKSVLDAIQAAFSENLQGVYFRQNLGFVLAGIIATLVGALAVASSLETTQASPLFLTFWLFFFTSCAGLVIAGVWKAKPAHPTPAQRIQRFLLPIFFFLLPGFLIYQFALPSAHFFVPALLISVALNSLFFVLMRAPTPEGRRILEQLAGFREFLVRVEQDRLERLNTPTEKAELMDRFLPYAIAAKSAWLT